MATVKDLLEDAVKRGDSQLLRDIAASVVNDVMTAEEYNDRMMQDLIRRRNEAAAQAFFPINQRGGYRWRDTVENDFSFIVASTANVERVPMSMVSQNEDITSESKKLPNVEDLPPVFKREIDL